MLLPVSTLRGDRVGSEALPPRPASRNTDPPGWAVWVTLVLSIPDLSMEFQLPLGSNISQPQIPGSRAAAG